MINFLHSGKLYINGKIYLCVMETREKKKHFFFSVGFCRLLASYISFIIHYIFTMWTLTIVYSFMSTCCIYYMNCTLEFDYHVLFFIEEIVRDRGFSGHNNILMRTSDCHFNNIPSDILWGELWVQGCICIYILLSLHFYFLPTHQFITSCTRFFVCIFNIIVFGYTFRKKNLFFVITVQLSEKYLNSCRFFICQMKLFLFINLYIRYKSIISIIFIGGQFLQLKWQEVVLLII